jgi:cytochrome c-type biogenesis protein CcmH/NrfG
VESVPQDEREAALRPLRTIGGVVTSLRRGSLAADEERSAVVQVASAVEMSLRRVLRDHPDIAVPIRLRALAPDELGSDEVLAELRQHDRISIGLAASVHDLLEARRRLKDGAPVAPGDGALAYRVADQLEHEVAEAPASRPELETIPPVADETVVLVADEPAASQMPLAYWAAGAALLLLVLLPLGIWLGRRGSDSEMSQGVALFRSGAFPDAASHFFRYAEAHPTDATPHLYLARIHRRLRRFDLAAPELRKAVELAPEDPAVQTELGLLLTDTRRYDIAIQRFREAIRLDPEYGNAWIGLVRALRAAGRPDVAAQVLTSAPADIRAMLTRSRPPADSVPA